MTSSSSSARSSGRRSSTSPSTTSKPTTRCACATAACSVFWHCREQCTPAVVPVAAQGVFVLHDKEFKWLHNIAPDSGAGPAPSGVKLIQTYLSLPCGMVRGVLGSGPSVRPLLNVLQIQFKCLNAGALCHLGVECSVAAAWSPEHPQACKPH